MWFDLNFKVHVMNICMVAMTEYGSVKPKIQAIYEGSMVGIWCLSYIKPDWFKNGMAIQSSSRVHEFPEQLLIYLASGDDSGVYKCIGRYKDGTTFVNTSRLIVGGRLQIYKHSNFITILL